MENGDVNPGPWVDSCLAALEPPSEWRPHADRALGQLRARGQSHKVGRAPLFRATVWSAVAVAAVVAVVAGLLLVRSPRLPVYAPAPIATALPLPPGQPASQRPRIANVSPPKVSPPASPKSIAVPLPAAPAATSFKESGSPAAPITVEVYLDFGCPPCAAFVQQIVPPLRAQYVQTGTVRLLLRDLPLPHHQYNRLAARYANAAGQAGYYDAAVAQIYKTSSLWSRDGDIESRLAQVLPADAMRKVRELVNSSDADRSIVDRSIIEDEAMARADRLNTTPGLVLVAKGERRVLGPVTSFSALQTQLDTLLAPQAAPAQAPKPNAGNPSTMEDFKAGDANREGYQRATDILKALEFPRGDWVADVGAGGGYYAMRLSNMVGPGGKVFAEDVSDASLGWLDRRVKLFDLRNVEIVKGTADNPNLPPASLAAVLVVNSYHHFTQHQAMAGQILRALKPGGRLVIADYSLTEHRQESRADQLKLHEIDPELVRTELVQAGFQVVKTEDPFLKRMPEVKDGDRIGAADMWLMIAIRPK